MRSALRAWLWLFAAAVLVTGGFGPPAHAARPTDLVPKGPSMPPAPEVFSVCVRDHENRPCALPGGIYWRLDVLDWYEKGYWQNWKQVEQFRVFAKKPLPPLAIPKPVVSEAPAQVLRLRFAVRPCWAGDLVLAEPVPTFDNPQKAEEIMGTEPRIGERESRVPLFHPRTGADSLMSYILTPRQIYTYGQEIRLAKQHDRTPAGDLSDEYRAYLLQSPVPEAVKQWARAVLKSHPELSDAERQVDKEGRIDLPHQAKVARVLSGHFAGSGQYRFSAGAPRKEPGLDCAADVLLTRKQGDAACFASSLAMMLRGVGIPARVVKGYRGSELALATMADPERPQPAGREYVIRQSHAHVWVQALVANDGQWNWQLLDPTSPLVFRGSQR